MEPSIANVCKYTFLTVKSHKLPVECSHLVGTVAPSVHLCEEVVSLIFLIQDNEAVKNEA